MLRKIFASVILLSLFASCVHAKTIVDAQGRSHTIPDRIKHVICSGSGCLRLLTYLQAQDMIVGVDSIEVRKRYLDARPYALANKQFEELPIFGEFRGHDNPEQILALDPAPDIILKAYSQTGYNPVELENKTGIPVISFNYGNLSNKRNDFEKALQIIGKVVNKEDRAQEVISFIQKTINDLKKRTADIAEKDVPSVFLGGVAFKGPHGLQSTEPFYPPFCFLKVKNLAKIGVATKKKLNHSVIAKEQILEWDPKYLFLDLSTLTLKKDGSGLYELQTDPSYATLSVVKTNSVFGLLPYNLYQSNHGSTLANSYFIGKLLYPEKFTDIDPQKKADEIYIFLIGKPLFNEMNSLFQNLVFSRIPINKHKENEE